MTAQMGNEVPGLHEAVLRKAALEVAQLDYRRALKHLDQQGSSQLVVAQALHISQTAVSLALKRARETTDTSSSFSGPGYWQEVMDALDEGLIDAETDEEILDRQHLQTA